MDMLDVTIMVTNALIDLHTAQENKNWDSVESARKRLQRLLDAAEDELNS